MSSEQLSKSTNYYLPCTVNMDLQDDAKAQHSTSLRSTCSQETVVPGGASSATCRPSCPTETRRLHQVALSDLSLHCQTLIYLVSFLFCLFCFFKGNLTIAVASNPIAASNLMDLLLLCILYIYSVPILMVSVRASSSTNSTCLYRNNTSAEPML